MAHRCPRTFAHKLPRCLWPGGVPIQQGSSESRCHSEAQPNVTCLRVTSRGIESALNSRASRTERRAREPGRAIQRLLFREEHGFVLVLQGVMIGAKPARGKKIYP